jgi:glutamate 5-kinase
VRARKRWIGGSLDVHGAVVVDDGAVRALASGKSLLPAGVRQVDGSFERGDAILVRGSDGGEVGRGLSGYDADEARAIMGAKTGDIPRILGYAGRAAMIHRDDLVLIGEAGSE